MMDPARGRKMAQKQILMQAERAFTERFILCMHMRGRQFEHHK